MPVEFFFTAAADLLALPCLCRAFVDAALRPFGQHLVAHLPQFVNHPPLGRVGLFQVAPRILDNTQQAFNSGAQQRVAFDALQ